MSRVCLITTSPLIVNFFLVPHLLHLRAHHEVCLAVTLPGEVPLRDLPGVEVIAVDVPRKISPWRDASALLCLRSLFRDRRFDLVHSFGPKAGLLAAVAGSLAGVPARVHTYTGQVWASRSGPLRALLRAADQVIGRQVTHALADSASQCAFLVQQGIVAAEKCRVLASGSVSGVDPQRFHPDPHARSAVRAELGIRERAPVILFVGRVTRDKGVLDLAAAFARLHARIPEVYLVVVGPDEEGLRGEMLGQCGEGAAANLRFVDYTRKPERYMAACDLLCLPSYREGFGSVVIEAAAAGIPAVASRIYGVTDAVEDGETGLLFEPGNRTDLADKLRLALTSEDLRSRLGMAARNRALVEFPEERLVRELERFYGEVLAG